MGRRHIIVFVAASVVMVCTTPFLIHEPLLLALGEFLVVREDQLQPADIIHVLGGRIDRVDYAVELYHQGYARRLFLTGWDRNRYQERAVAGGVRPEDVTLGLSRSASTYAEAVELEQLLERDTAIESVIVVSSPYHMRRAQWSFNQVLGERARLQFWPEPFERSSSSRRWWTDAESRRWVLIEYLKILSYYVWYGFR